MTDPKLPSVKKLALAVCHWPGHIVGIPDEQCKECRALVGAIRADRRAVLEAAAEVGDGWGPNIGDEIRKLMEEL